MHSRFLPNTIHALPLWGTISSGGPRQTAISPWRPLFTEGQTTFSSRRERGRERGLNPFPAGAFTPREVDAGSSEGFHPRPPLLGRQNPARPAEERRRRRRNLSWESHLSLPILSHAPSTKTISAEIPSSVSRRPRDDDDDDQHRPPPLGLLRLRRSPPSCRPIIPFSSPCFAWDEGRWVEGDVGGRGQNSALPRLKNTSPFSERALPPSTALIRRYRRGVKLN